MSRPVVVTPNVELWAWSYLSQMLPSRSESYASDVRVDVQPPPAKSLPDRVVWVRRDGGPREDMLYTSARLGVNVMCVDAQDADDLARLAEALLLSVSATSPVEAVRSLSGPSAITDPSGRPRRYFTVEVLARGAVNP